MPNITEPTALAIAAAAMIASAALLPSHTFAAELYPGAPVAPSCVLPDSNASATHLEEADWPSVARKMHLTGTTYVRVRIDESGGLSEPEIARSSGASVLDLAAIAAVQNSTFRPAIVNCSPTSGTFIIIVDFPGNE